MSRWLLKEGAAIAPLRAGGSTNGGTTEKDLVALADSRQSFRWFVGAFCNRSVPGGSARSRSCVRE